MSRLLYKTMATRLYPRGHRFVWVSEKTSQNYLYVQRQGGLDSIRYFLDRLAAFDDDYRLEMPEGIILRTPRLP